MVTGFDRIVIGVPDLAEVGQVYRDLLGVAPSPFSAAGETTGTLLPLANTALHFVERAGQAAKIEGLVFRSQTGGTAPTAVSNTLGLELAHCDGSTLDAFRADNAIGLPPDIAVDHVVLRTAQADTCIALFNGELGIRLALDQLVPEWGGRMLFFRGGKLTLEVLASETETAASAFWGITYQCADLDRMVAGLESRGVAHSDIRLGRKPGTRVATVKSHCLQIPTLLIEPASPAATPAFAG